MDELVGADMAYPNSSAKWPLAPLDVSKSGTEKKEFTLYFGAVNRYKIPHQYAMLLVENELT